MEMAIYFNSLFFIGSFVKPVVIFLANILTVALRNIEGQMTLSPAILFLM